ncbi:MAG: cyclic lactone autoinducer peptide [Ruminococcus sp.]|jgi:cyclic lactone autoinducer peptide|nr:cyclic lactone autoinducer peptide [Ruminococcus sp.]
MKSLKSVLSRAVEVIGTKSAEKSLNSSCVYFIYQPKMPAALSAKETDKK